MSSQVRVLVVDDSISARSLLTVILQSDPGIQVIGQAKDGKEGVELAKKLRPELITMDILMPVMDGFEATQHIMAECPTPILVVTASQNLRRDRDHIFDSIAMGALDVVAKPRIESLDTPGQSSGELIEKVKLLSRVKVVRHIAGQLKDWRVPKGEVQGDEQPRRSGVCHPSLVTPQRFEIVAIAASTGGPKALREVLGALPADFSAGVVIVQHIAAGFTAGMIEWLQRYTHLRVMEAGPNDWSERGVALVAPEGVHLVVAPGGPIRLVEGQPADVHRPSANVLFWSLAKSYGAKALGVILTGMGTDGASGLVEMKKAGAHVLAQDEATSAVFGMPKAAINFGAVDEVLPIEAIGPRIFELVKGGNDVG